MRNFSKTPPPLASPIGNTYRTRQYSWGDPNNWYSEPPSPVFDTADSDKIPCLTDTVVFNEVSSDTTDFNEVSSDTADFN